MNNSQMDMLSVKSAIERTVRGLVASYTSTCGTKPDLYNDVCRYMAGLFASKQITRNYTVSIEKKSLDVSFESNAKHYSKLSFLLPSPMLQRPTVLTALPEQEPLGEPFQTILDDNSWDLYSSSDE